MDTGFDKDEQMFSVYNNESPVDVYKSMAGGSAQINPLSDFLQESEQNMKSNVNIFTGSGYNLGQELPYIELIGPRDTFNNTFSVDTTMNVKSESDLKKPYKELCKPGENNDSCLKRIFECDPDRPWKECSDKIEPCRDEFTGQNMCKYNPDGSLIKRFLQPVPSTNVQIQRIG